jgi:hypothetical protein
MGTGHTSLRMAPETARDAILHGTPRFVASRHGRVDAVRLR